MQDNVTQARADWEFLRDTVTPPPFYHNEHAWSVMLSLIEKRLASTAQPEVKALVEAVERSAKMIDKAASAAVDQDSPALAEALDNIEFRLRLALAAYHEAQP